MEESKIGDDMITKRKLTSDERKWLILGLKTLKTGEYSGGGKWIDIKTGKVKNKDEPINPKIFLDQVDKLRVKSTCDCKSCKQNDKHIIEFDFDESKGGSNVNIVNYSIEYKPKIWRNLLIFINNKTGQLTSMEIV
jgi:hypothetical protein